MGDDIEGTFRRIGDSELTFLFLLGGVLSGAATGVAVSSAGGALFFRRHFVPVAVHHVMALQVDALREAFAADEADEGPLTRVRHVMADEATLLVENFTTKVARELLPAIGTFQDERRRRR